MPSGHPQEPGGWNRIVLHVKNLPALIKEMTENGLHFRNPGGGLGGDRFQLEDPDGIPVELFEPSAK